jgi:hypothetical protein
MGEQAMQLVTDSQVELLLGVIALVALVGLIGWGVRWARREARRRQFGNRDPR